HDNANSCTQAVTVIDNEVPSITCPAPVTTNANTGLCIASGVTLGTPATADNCGVASLTNDAPASYPVGTNIVTWTVVDVHGNSNSCPPAVIVLDTQCPTIACPANVLTTAPAGSCTISNLNLGSPVTADNCGVASVTSNAPAQFPLGTNAVTWTVVDMHGNTN